jgi:PAS domain S-box-containing protein
MYALDAAGAGIWEFDLATGATRWNERVSLMFGLGPRPVETVIDEFRARVHADDRGMIDAAIAQSIETDEPFRVDFRVPWPDGSIHWLVAKGRVLRNDASEPTGMMGICIDVTDRKELEQQLQHAQKLDSLGQFAGSITHDFNNVLTVILGFSDMLLGGLDPADERARDIEEIKKAGESGQRLARQLLAFSRQQSLEPTALDLNGSITSIVGILQQLLGANVALESVLADGLGTVWADAGQLQQILMNLAVNARDAMTKDGRLRIETRRATVSEWVAASQNVRPGAYIVLAVTDTGTGMSAETQARIFEPFFTTKAPGKGTGLGLSTVYGIVRQSKGFMEVVSTIGQGTTFRIYLPRLEDSK